MVLIFNRKIDSDIQTQGFLLNHNTILIQLFKFCIPAIILEPFI